MAGLATEAALATGTVVGSTGGILVAIAFVEGASTSVSLFLTALPFLP